MSKTKKVSLLLGALFLGVAFSPGCGGAAADDVGALARSNYQCRVHHHCDGGSPSSADAGSPPPGDAGTPPTGAVCTGRALSLSTQDEGAAFHVAAGVSLTQFSTSLGSSFLTYYDVPAYLPFADRVLFNSGGASALSLVSMSPDGTDAQALVKFDPCSGGLPGYQLSADGRFLVYARVNDGARTCDLYGIRLDGAGTCAALETRLTTLAFDANRKVEVSPPAYDAQGGHYLAAFAIDPAADGPHLYVVRDDGKNPRSPSETGALDVPLDEPEAGLGWHRVRMNPSFPNLIFFRHEAPAKQVPTKNYYVLDWSKSVTPHAVTWCDDCSGSHPTWTPDGRRTAIDGAWTEFDIASATGDILEGLAIVAPNHGRVIGPFGRGDAAFQNIMYGSYSPDGKQVAVVTTPLQDARGGRIFLMNTATGSVKYLSEAHSGFTLIKGQPRLHFVRGTGGVLFSSDNSFDLAATLAPSLYLLTGYGALP